MENSKHVLQTHVMVNQCSKPPPQLKKIVRLLTRLQIEVRKVTYDSN